MNDVGKIRNKLTHFGLDKQLDFHEVILVINNSIEIISTLIYEKLKPIKDKEHILDPIYEIMLDTLEVAKIEEEEAWAVFFAEQFEDLNIRFAELEEDKEFNFSLNQKKFGMEVELGKYSNSYRLKCSLLHETDDDLSQIISTQNFPYLNSTFFVGECVDGPIYFILDHSVSETDGKKFKNFFIYKEPHLRADFENSIEKFWLDDERNGLCFGTVFNYDQLMRALKITLNICK